MILRSTYVREKTANDIIIENLVEDYLDALPRFTKLLYQKPGKWVEPFVVGKTNILN